MDSRPLLLGHRGAREKGIRENTIEAFDRALAAGADGFEFDVRLSADGQAVICHDPSSLGQDIRTHSAHELNLPLLGDVLERYHTSAFLDIELKVTGLEAMAAELLKQFSPARGFVVSSFLPECLVHLHSTASSIPLGLICETRQQLGRWRDLPIEYVMPQVRLIREGWVIEAHEEKKKSLPGR
ncbi:MAG TPA: glycerophosphodiester phosphodiesterase [Candidatus Binatia bacterium]|nr:glycerophosphodiester phosphodiesterase [Candidatus Binatia bacterium]